MTESKWKGRVRKTQQDRTSNAGSRPRTQEWDKRKAFMAKYHPRKSSDWMAYRNTIKNS